MPESAIRRLTTRRNAPRPEHGEIVVDWELIADGRPRRLARGVDFADEVTEFGDAARRVASSMGRSVVLTRDRLHPDRFIWVQFADGEIAIGEPCVCGSHQLTRLSAVLVRCDACGARLIAGTKPKKAEVPSELESGEPAAPGPARTLSEFSEIRLVRTAHRKNVIEYVGLGVDETGRQVLLAVRVPLVAGEPIPDPSSPTGQGHEIIKVVPESSWGQGVSDDDEAWDIVVA